MLCAKGILDTSFLKITELQSYEVEKVLVLLLHVISLPNGDKN